ncbi:hypothetical protein [Streptomyces olivochromogenes]|uniref:hypothetical protein n=1 Tax=Streptomyces olivochromogenes TaxID=1963 RepID=UPI001F3FC5A9|nr:hypothetical protein [Streptomyces olivochromogenes]MCF3131868.1 hypothetical protein [Streptomyces olivochromogenes]
MNPRTTTRTTARLRLAALAVLPVLAVSTACGGDGEAKDEGIASVPDSPSSGSGSSGSGSSGSGSAGKSGTGDKGAFYDAQMAYVQCMRGKGGVKDFPDPKLSGYLDWTKIDELAQRPGNEEASKGGRNGVCGKEMSEAMKLEPKRDVQKEYESMLAHAKCMRENGVSKFTNPTMSGGNVIPGGDPNPASPQLDVRSPAYKQATQACKDKLLDGLDGMQ